MGAKRMKILLIVALVIVVIGAVAGIWLYNNSRLYISTNDAYVDGRQIVIGAPAAGKIVDWRGTVGTTFGSGSTVGNVQVQSGNSSSDVPIPVPTDATIVQRSAVNNEFVAPGTPLAYAYNMNDLWVTANVKETDLHALRLGEAVDVTVDAYPGVVLHGQVEQIGLATANTFSLLPSSSNNANFTKVTQVVPVKISIQGYQGLGLVPGLSVSVRIHKQ
ncbi:efflux RND transporter periplasmic adaptor subunit [Alicyclobacillus tolerans]|uniref:HlyD family secretion protein n=1 Tax=Alicyclobacillus tolerans TaxID=90970 RepID=UPI001F36D87C|nr:efflux RND transporter periplasmic adaptor subunit [Alicyclobacillus tolerans]MCF8567668.1 efflux RND transporter periplasmic adaptor subunit [Alicyclobacillus tolerans]